MQRTLRIVDYELINYKKEDLVVTSQHLTFFKQLGAVGGNYKVRITIQSHPSTELQRLRSDWFKIHVIHTSVRLILLTRGFTSVLVCYSGWMKLFGLSSTSGEVRITIINQ